MPIKIKSSKQSINSKTKTEDKDVEQVNDDLQSVNDGNRRIRQCLKEKPIQPLNMGTIKTKSTKPKVKIVSRKIHNANRKKRSTNNRKVVPKKNSSKSSSQNKTLKTKSIKATLKDADKHESSKTKQHIVPKIVVDASSAGFKSGVIFNPRTGCQACEGGRKGEGDVSCWACRLARLQNITDKCHQSFKNV